MPTLRDRKRQLANGSWQSGSVNVYVSTALQYAFRLRYSMRFDCRTVCVSTAVQYTF